MRGALTLGSELGQTSKTFVFFCFKIYFCSKGRVTRERGGERENERKKEENLPSTDFPPQMAARLEWGQTKARSLKLLPGLPCWQQGSQAAGSSTAFPVMLAGGWRRSRAAWIQIWCTEALKTPSAHLLHMYLNEWT